MIMIYWASLDLRMEKYYQLENLDWIRCYRHTARSIPTEASVGWLDILSHLHSWPIHRKTSLKVIFGRWFKLKIKCCVPSLGVSQKNTPLWLQLYSLTHEELQETHQRLCKAIFVGDVLLFEIVTSVLAKNCLIRFILSFEEWMQIV
jgi:hypothetical protein